MSDDRRVECPVMISSELTVGVFANAFRVVHDAGNDWFLDFLTFSASENTAQVVSRVRVTEPFMDSVRMRLESTMTYIHEERFKDSKDDTGMVN
jgi:hypothetical protein